MLRNNLAKLMIDRGITATQLFNDTGIARSTISKISNNNTDKISLSTIDKICNYLHVTPADFFDFIPFEFDVKVLFEKFDSYEELEEYFKKFFDYKSETTFEVILNVHAHNQRQSIFFNGSVKVESIGGKSVLLTDVTFSLSPKSENSVEIVNNMPIRFQTDILEKIKSEITDYMHLIPFGEMDSIGLEIFNSYWLSLPTPQPITIRADHSLPCYFEWC